MFASVLFQALISRLHSLLTFIFGFWPISRKATMASSSSTYSAPGSYPLPTPPPYQPAASSRASPTSASRAASASGSQTRPPVSATTAGTFIPPRMRVPSAPTPSATPSVSTTTTTSITPAAPIAPVLPVASVVSNGQQNASGGEARLVIALDYGTTYTGKKEYVPCRHDENGLITLCRRGICTSDR